MPRYNAITALIVAMLCLGTTARAQTPMDRFIAYLEERQDVPAKAAALIKQTWEACEDCDGNELLTQGLALLSAEFREGLDAYDAEEPEACIEAMRSLAEDENPFLAVHAAVYEIKALVDLERAPEALERLEAVIAEQDERVRLYSYLAPEVDFLRGYCLVLDLQYDEGERAIRAFLDGNPDAPQRLRVAAEQMLGEIANRRTGGIGEVTDLMDYSGRRLLAGDSGEPVQSRQERIIELLDKLIKDAEDREQNSPRGGSSNSRPRSPQAPMPESQLPPGNPQGGELREARRANPGEVWGKMPPAERERILQAIRSSFPSRYRQLVEQYYEELAKKP
jgi:tetratricopeptide (TPR) repeat protein